MSKSKTAEKRQSLPATPTKWSEHPLLALREEMDDLLSRFFGTDDGSLGGRLSPAMDLSETDTSIQVAVDLPGVTPDEIDIQLSGNTLIIRGDRKEEKDDRDKTFHRIERRSDSFTRSVTLPCTVNEDEVAAEYKDGVLIVALPKSDEAKRRKIKVKR
jgi:HSP20 family protein